MVNIKRYTKESHRKWDVLVNSSHNGTFLFNRNYMEYHSSRFVDHSLIISIDDCPIALLPATVHEDEIRSHGGLTYGGIICDHRMNQVLMLKIFENVCEYYERIGKKKLIYKPIPHMYHMKPRE